MSSSTKRQKSIAPSSKTTTNLTHSPNLLQLPPETFLEISKSLAPVDLLSLSLVCKTFYSDLCCSESITVQEIWRQSRLTYMPFRLMGPPDGMNEREYIRFLIEDKCYFCGTKISGEFFFISMNIPRPFLQNGSRSHRFWRDQVQSKYIELCSIAIEDQNDWMYQQYQLRNDLQREIAERRREDVLSRENQRSQRIQDIGDKLDIMCEERDENEEMKYQRSILEKCPSLRRCYTYERPFSERG
ncbi:15559_t:CDS:2 [Racocetra fulgida]|uniref:15559_t:CDS:1 n=1 Tax=Racocetra fulgida TaxID=60492 RepID=A0A9N8ZIY6_9GLOM|nr:15559_t:CDS:2 [Racocetra fulgida]